ncbi:thiamine diphosphokinase [Ancylomarina salipaludis]|uniref:Thiamine diphosphokinase n=1 Tax=Ancylomarina salipaludis TaxID=2501299 RepID=A0A4Q1JQA7_9BACT|nr:thiamine diphosphokinase [Ancylomarina salipaludis]RXQ97612.1 thiamine diphosphokinase [Ancylomarina salipaludis]
MRSKSAVILANGSFPVHEIPLNSLKSSECIVCCDGAINKLETAGIEAHAIVGDLDSLSDDLKRKYQDIIHHFSNQDTNDLTKAVNWCLANKINDITIVGATGERDDHMIGNIFLLPSYTKKMKVKMLTDYGIFTPVMRSRNFDSYIGQQVSIFSPQAETIITTANLRYELTNQKLDMLWQGTLNESMGDSFRIDFEGNSLIVYQEYEK